MRSPRFADTSAALQSKFMCGRYRLSRRKEVLTEHFGADFADVEWEPRYNIAPTQSVPVIRREHGDGNLKVSMMRWGLIPSWASDSKVGASNINARSETMAEKPSFRVPLRIQRCLIPADGFYEWQRTGKLKQPYCFEVGDASLFAFAGLWDRWRAADGDMHESFTIVTTTANESMRKFHDRMPVILPPDAYDRWLDPAMRNPASAIAMLKPFDSKPMTCYPVSTRINIVTNDDALSAASVDLPVTTADLF